MELRERWLEYAWRVVNCDHLEECRKAGGDPNDADCESNHRDVRYPGYYGPEYREGGVLCVAMVHNARDLFKRGFSDVETATSEWKHGRIGSDDYVARVQAGYLGSVTEWGPWNQFSGPLKHIFDINDDAVAAARIAYVNLAKCWTIVSQEVDRRVITLCQSREPIKRLVREILKPSVVLVWNVSNRRRDFGIPEDELEDRIYHMYASDRPLRKGPKKNPIVVKVTKGQRSNGDPVEIWQKKARAAYLAHQK